MSSIPSLFAEKSLNVRNIVQSLLMSKKAIRTILFCALMIALIVVLCRFSDYKEPSKHTLSRRSMKSEPAFDASAFPGDDIQTSLGFWPYVKRDRYPRRVNMSACEPRYGKIGVFVVIDNKGTGKYKVARKSLECYLKSTPYEYFVVNTDTDPIALKHCARYRSLFRKHCTASVYLKRVDWLVIMDADTGVVNPNHCIEEYIDTRTNLIFYERAFAWEIMAGNLIVRNTKMGHDFLMKIADADVFNLFGLDQGPMPYYIMKLVVPSAVHEAQVCFKLWRNVNPADPTGIQFDHFFEYVSCCKQVMGSTRYWPGKVRIYRRFHGWARDSYFNEDYWNDDVDFMIHNWKLSEIDEDAWQSPFKTILHPERCGMNLSGWNWRPEKRVSVEQLREQLAVFEKEQQAWFPKTARGLTYLNYPDIGDCWPRCEDHEN